MLQKAFLVAVVLAAAAGACPSLAQARIERVSCETVRAFVAQMGLDQARAIALAHGMTRSQERRARRCLDNVS